MTNTKSGALHNGLCEGGGSGVTSPGNFEILHALFTCSEVCSGGS